MGHVQFAIVQYWHLISSFTSVCYICECTSIADGSQKCTQHMWTGCEWIRLTHGLTFKWHQPAFSYFVFLYIQVWEVASETHYSDVKMGAMVSQITSLTIVYSTVYSGAGQIKQQSSASLAFVRGIHRWPMNSAHKWSVTRKVFPFDDVITGHVALRYCFIEKINGCWWLL